MNFTLLSDYLGKIQAEYKIPAVCCCVYRRHEELFRFSSGCTQDSGFWLYSASKLCTAAAAVQMTERGLFREDEPVSRYLPEFGRLKIKSESGCEVCTRPLLIKDIVSMQGGFSYEMYPELTEYAAAHPEAGTRELISRFADIPLLFEPGTHFSYSWCLDILGGLMEAAAGCTLGQWMEEEIFRPLEMKHTGFHPKSEEREKLCPQFRMDENGSVLPTVGENFCRLTENFESAGGGLYSTLSDYSVLADALACGGIGRNGARILDESSIEKLKTNLLGAEALKDFRKRYTRPGYGYGCGVRTCISDTNPEPKGCFGWDGAAGAHVLVDAAGHISLVYMQHVLDMEFIYDGVFPDMDGLLYRALG